MNNGIKELHCVMAARDLALPNAWPSVIWRESAIPDTTPLYEHFCMELSPHLGCWNVEVRMVGIDARGWNSTMGGDDNVHWYVALEAWNKTWQECVMYDGWLDVLSKHSAFLSLIALGDFFLDYSIIQIYQMPAPSSEVLIWHHSTTLDQGKILWCIISYNDYWRDFVVTFL